MTTQQNLANFIRDSFRTIWSLELLLYLKRHEDRAWTPEELRVVFLLLGLNQALLARAQI